MSWHGRWKPGEIDPFAKPANKGDRFGCFEVVRAAQSDAHYGSRALVRCVRCGLEQIRVLAQLRHNAPKRHRGCKAPREASR